MTQGQLATLRPALCRLACFHATRHALTGAHEGPRPLTASPWWRLPHSQSNQDHGANDQERNQQSHSTCGGVCSYLPTSASHIPTHAEHVGDQLLRHNEFVALQPVQAQKQPTAQLLIEEWCRLQTAVCAICVISAWVYRSSKVQDRSIPVELLLKHLRLEPEARPVLCTTARLGVDSPPMKSEMPTVPSLPTTAISADAPSPSCTARRR